MSSVEHAVSFNSGTLSGTISKKFLFSLSDHVTIKLVVHFHDIFIASVDFSFYDCAAVALLWKSAP